MAPWERNKFGAPMFEPQAFWEKIYSLERSTCDIVGTSRLPGIVPPSVRPCVTCTSGIPLLFAMFRAIR